jgi:predicted RNA-binding Zn-ribbon protein involved in translation (DUF1610 family)
MKDNRDQEKKVNMNVDMENQRYVCPECGHVVNWEEEKE